MWQELVGALVRYIQASQGQRDVLLEALKKPDPLLAYLVLEMLPEAREGNRMPEPDWETVVGKLEQMFRDYHIPGRSPTASTAVGVGGSDTQPDRRVLRLGLGFGHWILGQREYAKSGLHPELIARLLPALMGLDWKLQFHRCGISPWWSLGDPDRRPQDWTPNAAFKLFPRRSADWEEPRERSLLTLRVLRDIVAVALTPSWTKRGPADRSSVPVSKTSASSEAESTYGLPASVLNGRVSQTLSRLIEERDPLSSVLFENGCGAVHRLSCQKLREVFAAQEPGETPVAVEPAEVSGRFRVGGGRKPWSLWWICLPDQPDVSRQGATGQTLTVMRQAIYSNSGPVMDRTRAWILAAFSQRTDAMDAADVVWSSIRVPAALFGQTLAVMQWDLLAEGLAIHHEARRRAAALHGPRTAVNTQRFGIFVSHFQRRVVEAVADGRLALPRRPDREKGLLPDGIETAVEKEMGRYREVTKLLESWSPKSEEPSKEVTPEDLALALARFDDRRALLDGLNRLVKRDEATATNSIARKLAASLRPTRSARGAVSGDELEVAEFLHLQPHLGGTLTDLFHVLDRAWRATRAN